jgi:hypothetical protein
MKEIYKALAAFQQEVPTIHKDTKGYGYSYADLPTIFEAINPLLQKHGLGFTQTVNGTQLCTTVFHVKSGEEIEGCADIPQGVTLKGMNDFQVLGSAITYMRRYQLSAMLGLVTDKDTDANGQQQYNYKSSTPSNYKASPKAQRVIVTEGDENYLKIIQGVSSGKATLQQALDKFNISESVESKLKEQIQALQTVV